jgi:hypothetical protein
LEASPVIEFLNLDIAAGAGACGKAGGAGIEREFVGSHTTASTDTGGGIEGEGVVLSQPCSR